MDGVMADRSGKARRVYRLLPGLGEFRTLLIEGPSLRKLIHWQRSGSPEDRPTELRTRWSDDDQAVRPAEFASAAIGAPLLSRRVADLFYDELATAGGYVPVLIDGADTGEYVLYLVEKVVDCVDIRRSSKPRKRSGEIKKVVFRADAVPLDLPAFRIPESLEFVYWNGSAADRLTSLLGDDLEARLIWAADPARSPHPNPWRIL